MGDRYYEVQLLPNGETFRFPSVTTILGKVLAKPGLEQWYYRKAVEGFSALLTRYGSNTPVDSPSIYSLLSTDNLTPHAHRDAAADWGKKAHAHLEKLLLGKKVKVTPEVSGIHKWYEDTKDTFDLISAERQLINFSKRYGGTADIIYRDHETGGIVIGDAKTGKFRWNYFLQLEAYRQAWEDTAWSRKGDEGKTVRLEVLNFPADDPTTYRVYSYTPDSELSDAWDSVLNLYRVERKIKNG